jgi:thiamine biosynthesis lipoprotein
MTPSHRTAPDPKSRQAIAVMVIALLVLALVLRHVLVPTESERTPQTDAPLEEHAQEFAIFNTYGRIDVYADADTASAAFGDILTDMRKLHDTINRFDEQSELSKLNQTASVQPFACSKRLWDILQQARRGYSITHGAFDVTVGPLMELWGFHRKRETLPSDAEIEEALQKVGMDKIAFDDRKHTVSFTADGMSLDLGGIAKGYALDRVVAILKTYHINRGLVDLGGNISCLNQPPPARPSYAIGIRNPFDTSSLLGRIQIVGRAIATSGNYERYVEIQGQTIAHIVDPRSGRPVSDVQSVTVITPSGTDSDILSTALFVAGEPLLDEVHQTMPDTTVIRVLLDEDGRAVTQTTGPVRLLPP